jgi:hypothetical protein
MNIKNNLNKEVGKLWITMAGRTLIPSEFHPNHSKILSTLFCGQTDRLDKMNVAF